MLRGKGTGKGAITTECFLIVNMLLCEVMYHSSFSYSQMEFNTVKDQMLVWSFVSVLADCQHVFSICCILQCLQQSYGCGSPGADIVQRYSWLVQAWLSHVLACCSVSVGLSVELQGFSAFPPYPPFFSEDFFPLSYLA